MIRDMRQAFVMFVMATLAVCSLIGVAYILANIFTKPAWGQHNHERYHPDYMSWSSGKTSNCCNNQDCGQLSDSEYRQSKDGDEVRIDGQWCPVLKMHRLIKGKSPDWTSAHACISHSTAMPPCERLLCFTGKGGV